MPKGISLHIGLNQVDPAHYEGWRGELSGCEPDAEDMQALAQGLGYETQVLKTAQATRAAVTGAIEAAAGTLRPGDIFFISYSGHGGQVPDEDGDEDDFMDETWMLHDGQLVDDELYALWSKMAKGVRVIVLSDSCHSGTVTRTRAPEDDPFDAIEDALLGLTWRGAPRDVLVRTYRANRSFYDEIAAATPKTARDTPQATIRLIGGCQDNQRSLDGIFNGLFTAKLLRVWNKAGFDGDYRSFHAAILREMPAFQSPSHFVVGAPDPAFDRQRPFAIE